MIEPSSFITQTGAALYIQLPGVDYTTPTHKKVAIKALRVFVGFFIFPIAAFTGTAYNGYKVADSSLRYYQISKDINSPQDKKDAVKAEKEHYTRALRCDAFSLSIMGIGATAIVLGAVTGSVGGAAIIAGLTLPGSPIAFAAFERKEFMDSYSQDAPNFQRDYFC